MKKQKGITLIALVITIIVLLILAGVSISLVTGEDGILERAIKSREKTQEAQADERDRLDSMADVIDNHGKTENPGNEGGSGEPGESGGTESAGPYEDENTVPTPTKYFKFYYLDYDLSYEENYSMNFADDENNDEIYHDDYYGDSRFYNYNSYSYLASDYYLDSNCYKTFQYYYDKYLNNTDKKVAVLVGVKPEYSGVSFYEYFTSEYTIYCNITSIIDENGSKITDIVIPYEVEEDGITYNVKCIGERALGIRRMGGDYRMTGTEYTNIVIPNTITDIEDYAFYGHAELTDIKIPNSVTKIGAHAFATSDWYYDTKLENVTIGENVINIGNSAFDGCRSLKNITIPDGVTSIKASTFYRCTALESITIPKSVTTIENGAFYESNALKNVYYTGSEAEWQNISIGNSYGNTVLTSATKHYNHQAN